MKKRSYRGLGFYAMLVFVVILVWLMLDARQDAAHSYSMKSLETALENESVVFIEIEQNREIPTGTLSIRLSGNEMRELYVSDVNEIQELLAKYQFKNYYVSDVHSMSGRAAGELDFEFASAFNCACRNVYSVCHYDKSGGGRRRRKQNDELWQKPREDVDK